MQDPQELFQEWFEEASKHDKFANAVALSTVSEAGKPASRMVLMKGISGDGFTFFTNHGSRKARELDCTPKAALCFYWRHLDRSVRVEGSVTRVTEEESDAYFQARPRGSQLGAWCSAQSTEVATRQVCAPCRPILAAAPCSVIWRLAWIDTLCRRRCSAYACCMYLKGCTLGDEGHERGRPCMQVLHDEYARLKEQYAGTAAIPRPPFWGGYRIKPFLMEFWHDQASRLHDRLEFSRDAVGGDWRVRRLSP